MTDHNTVDLEQDENGVWQSPEAKFKAAKKKTLKEAKMRVAGAGAFMGVIAAPVMASIVTAGACLVQFKLNNDGGALWEFAKDAWCHGAGLGLATGTLATATLGYKTVQDLSFVEDKVKRGDLISTLFKKGMTYAAIGSVWAAGIDLVNHNTSSVAEQFSPTTLLITQKELSKDVDTRTYRMQHPKSC